MAEFKWTRIVDNWRMSRGNSRLPVTAIMNKLTIPGVHKTIKVPTIIARMCAALFSLWFFDNSLLFTTISCRFSACNLFSWIILCLVFPQLLSEDDSYLLQNRSVDECVENDYRDCWQEIYHTNKQQKVEISNDSQIALIVKLFAVPSERR